MIDFFTNNLRTNTFFDKNIGQDGSFDLFYSLLVSDSCLWLAILFDKKLRLKHTYIDELVVVSLSQVMENGGIVKIGQVRHILGLFVFWWIDLLEDIFLEILRLDFKEKHILVRSELVTYVYQLHIISLTEIMQNACFIENGHVAHIFNFFELRGIHLHYLRRF